MARRTTNTSRIIELYKEGYTIGQIAQELNINHAHVSRTVKKNFPGAQPTRRSSQEVKMERALKLQEEERRIELQDMLKELKKEEAVTTEYLQNDGLDNVKISQYTNYLLELVIRDVQEKRLDAKGRVNLLKVLSDMHFRYTDIIFRHRHIIQDINEITINLNNGKIDG